MDDLVQYGYAPGNYVCKCSDCKYTHIADKCAWRCESCAIKASEIEITDTTGTPLSNMDAG